MNVFIGIGKITDVNHYGKISKFNLVTEHGKPCHIPCVIFNPDDGVKKSIESLQSSKKVVWLQGRLSSYDFEHGNRVIRKVDVLTHPKSIRII